MGDVQDDLTKYEGGIDGLKADIDDDMNFNLSGVNYKSTTYSMAAFYRHYLGLGRVDVSVCSMKWPLNLVEVTLILPETMTDCLN